MARGERNEEKSPANREQIESKSTANFGGVFYGKFSLVKCCAMAARKKRGIMAEFDANPRKPMLDRMNRAELDGHFGKYDRVVQALVDRLRALEERIAVLSAENDRLLTRVADVQKAEGIVRAFEANAK